MNRVRLLLLRLLLLEIREPLDRKPNRRNCWFGMIFGSTNNMIRLVPLAFSILYSKHADLHSLAWYVELAMRLIGGMHLPSISFSVSISWPAWWSADFIQSLQSSSHRRLCAESKWKSNSLSQILCNKCFVLLCECFEALILIIPQSSTMPIATNIWDLIFDQYCFSYRTKTGLDILKQTEEEKKNTPLVVVSFFCFAWLHGAPLVKEVNIRLYYWQYPFLSNECSIRETVYRKKDGWFMDWFISDFLKGRQNYFIQMHSINV